MNGKANQAVPAPQAALILVYGTSGATNKIFPLDRDATILGKGRGCDLILEAADISTTHCVVTRNGVGYMVRDCHSRSGTRLNGDRVEEGILRDGDLIQIGPFSFRAKLPPIRMNNTSRDNSVRLLNLERKRLRLARMALSLRQRLQHLQIQQSISSAPEPNMESSQLLQQAELLQQRLRECELRANQLDQAERELTADRANLIREINEFQAESQEKEQELKQRQAELEKHWQDQQKKLEQHWQDREKQLEENWRKRNVEADQQWRNRQAELEHHWRERHAELDHQANASKGDAEAALNQARQEWEHKRQQAERDLKIYRQQMELELEARRNQLEQAWVQKNQQAENEWIARNQRLEESIRLRQEELVKTIQHQEAALEQEMERYRQQQLQVNGLANDDEEVSEAELEKTCLLPLGFGNQAQTHLPAQPEAADEQRRLMIRRRELEYYSQYLRRTHGRLQAHQEKLEQEKQNLSHKCLEMQMAQQEAHKNQHQVGQEQTDVADLVNRQQAALAQAESVVRGQCEALLHMMAEIKQMQNQLPMSQDSTAEEALRQENEELRQQLQKQEKVFREQEQLFLEQVQALRDREQSVRDSAADNSEGSPELEQLRNENQVLQKLLEEKETALEELKTQGEGSVLDMPAIEDVDSYEAELVQFRRQLEKEREVLKREMEQIRIKNEEMDETTREIEMELSRERADLARERIRLERMRDEIQTDLERLQRNGGLNERLAPVNKLREEISEGRKSSPNVNPSSPTPPPANKSDPGLGALRSLRNR